ncbi:MAG: hypothetical protein MZV64_12445 [Ignavibacteriales bacterium]|nr:hypothetical protein [Ignavibacteriales bacterium]
MTGVIIPDYWVKLFVTPFQMPLVVDHATGAAPVRDRSLSGPGLGHAGPGLVRRSGYRR